jgi:surface protein
MYGMFFKCSSLKKVPKFDTSNVTDMRIMFFGCSNLEKVPKLDTSKVIDMDYIFYNCSNLKYIPENFPQYDWHETCSEILKENYPEFFI